MANIYTKDDTSLSNKVFFLNGNNLTHVLNIDGKVNPIPSLTLMANVNKRVTKLSSEVQGLNKTDELGTGKILRSLSQDKGQISYTASEITDEDFNSGTLSQSKIKGLTSDMANMSACYFPKDDFDKTLSNSFAAGDYDYNVTEHRFELNVKGNLLTIPMSKIFQGQIIKSVSVRTDEEGVKWIDIKFDDEEYSVISIRVRDLVQIYQKGPGIDINDQLYISADSTIARQSSIDNMSCDFSTTGNIITSLVQTNGKVDVGSTKLLSSHVGGLDTYVTDRISNISTSIPVANGIIKSIGQENGVVEITNGAIVSSDFKYNQETGDHSYLPIDYIAGLENKLSDLDDTDWRSLKFNGHIEHVSQISSCDYLSALFKGKGLADFDKIYNGSFLQINFEDGISAKTKCEDTIYENGDYLILHDHNSKKRIIEQQDVKIGDTAFLIHGGLSRREVEEKISKLTEEITELKARISDMESFFKEYQVMVK